MQLTTARQAIHDAYATHLTSKGLEANFRAEAKKPDFAKYLRTVHRCKEETREALLEEFSPVGFYAEDTSQKLDTNSMICHAVEAGMIISAVERLDDPFKAWVKWAYGPRTEEFLPEQGRFFRWLDNDVTENFASIDRVYREVTKEKIRDVVAYTVLNYRSFVISGRELYPKNLIINRCKIHRCNWKRDFETWHDYYWNLCDHYLDRLGLPTVASVVLRLKYGKER
ncbi:bacteriophage antitermination protein Q [Endozoicomonas sp. SESOKO1]|uniref:bacteriophage antitermination protein Q n=1 Tax=Endozoicomonas sp. SESOKO1 TaxID=2828742 RepID=UPI0021496A48|nr:bacteriophage antitermination protein Q [Endozoicomonas sp. SESOKO1]